MPRGQARNGRRWRSVEAIVAAVAAVVLSPLLLAIALAVYADDGGSVVFVQDRIGRQGRRFRMLKFRTMKSGRAPRPPAAPFEQFADDPRLTRVGRGLRRTHADELPQLLNIVAGHMSFVGPRPLVPEEDALVSRLWPDRHDYRPGLTGEWQLRRSPHTTVEELITLDRGYLERWSPWRDVVLVASTARCFVRGSGR